MHAYSARVDAALREAFADRGPDLIEFCDYLGEGFVTAQARESQDPWLEQTRICVRLHTTAYLCAVLDGQLADDFATTAIFDAERYVLSRADTVLWPGGDVLGTYERIYGRDALAPATKLPDAFLDETDGTAVDREAPRRGPGAAAPLSRAPRTPQGSAEPRARDHGPREPGRTADPPRRGYRYRPARRLHAEAARAHGSGRRAHPLRWHGAAQRGGRVHPRFARRRDPVPVGVLAEHRPRGAHAQPAGARHPCRRALRDGRAGQQRLAYPGSLRRKRSAARSPSSPPSRTRCGE